MSLLLSFLGVIGVIVALVGGMKAYQKTNGPEWWKIGSGILFSLSILIVFAAITFGGCLFLYWT